jgi:chromosome segregation ATPase
VHSLEAAKKVVEAELQAEREKEVPPPVEDTESEDKLKAAEATSKKLMIRLKTTVKELDDLRSAAADVTNERDQLIQKLADAEDALGKANVGVDELAGRLEEVEQDRDQLKQQISRPLLFLFFAFCFLALAHICFYDLFYWFENYTTR